MTDGAFSDEGAFHPLATWDGDAVTKLFRERLLARLVERQAISEDLVRKLLTARGLSPPEEEKPPPVRDVVRLPVDDEGREIQAS